MNWYEWEWYYSFCRPLDMITLYWDVAQWTLSAAIIILTISILGHFYGCKEFLESEVFI